MIDINSLKIGDSVNHIEHGLVTIVMLQAYKGYDFIGYEYLENYHKDELSKFYPVENKPDPLINKLRNKLNFYRDEFDKADTQDKKIEMQGRMAGISNAIAIVEINRK